MNGNKIIQKILICHTGEKQQLVVPNFILKLSEASTKTETDHHFLESQPQSIGNDQG